MTLVALIAPVMNALLISPANALLASATRPVEHESGLIIICTNSGIVAFINDEHFCARCCHAKEAIMVIAIAR